MKENKENKVKEAVTITCKKCGRTLPAVAFPHDYRRKSTRYIYCRECEAKRQYDKYTQQVIKNAEENGFVVLKITHPRPIMQIDVLKIDNQPNLGKLTITELQPSE